MLLCLYIEKGVYSMITGAELLSDLETLSCGCTVISSATSVKASCITCGNLFEKIDEKKLNNPKRGKNENCKIELVNKPAFLPPDVEEIPVCKSCYNSGEIKVFTQEWDRIKSHAVPCPLCDSNKWIAWSEGKRLVKYK